MRVRPKIGSARSGEGSHASLESNGNRESHVSLHTPLVRRNDKPTTTRDERSQHTRMVGTASTAEIEGTADREVDPSEEEAAVVAGCTLIVWPVVDVVVAGRATGRSEACGSERMRRSLCGLVASEEGDCNGVCMRRKHSLATRERLRLNM